MPEMMASGVNRHHASETLTEERCHIRELLNSDADPKVSIAQARIEQGVTTAWHAVLNTEERLIVRAGSGEVEIGGAKAESIAEGDTVMIPAGVKQRVRNTGNADLIFDCVCTPRFEWRNYQSLE